MTDSKSVHTAPSSLLDLEDILREILLYCSKPTLAISLRVSHLFFDIAGRILYRYIHRDEATFDCVLRGVLELDGIGGGLKNQKTNKGNGKKVKEVKKGEKPNSESGIDPIPPGSPALSSSDTCSVTEQINTKLGSPGKYAYAQYLPPLSAPMLLSGTTTPLFPTVGCLRIVKPSETCECRPLSGQTKLVLSSLSSIHGRLPFGIRTKRGCQSLTCTIWTGSHRDLLKSPVSSYLTNS